MKKSVLKALAIGITSSLLLTGCGSQFPEMTQEEYDQVVQYSVNLLLKYSNNGVERLSSLSALEMQKQIEKENREAAKAARDAENAAAMGLSTEETQEEETDLAMAEETQIPEENETEEPVEEQVEETEEPSEETTFPSEEETVEEPKEEEIAQEETSEASKEETEEPESTQETKPEQNSEEDDIDKLLEKYEDDLQEGIDNSSEAEEPESEQPVSEETSEEVLTTETDNTVDGMRQEISKGIFLTYSGYSVNSSYADESEVFSITATSGNKLLILNFKLINTSGMDVAVDMVKANPHFQIILNGTNVGYTNVTMLQNDLSSFTGTIPAGAKVNMVLVKQMKADKVKTVESLGLIGDLKGETTTFNLE